MASAKPVLQAERGSRPTSTLRERPDDIPLLVEHFISRFNKRLGRAVDSVTPKATAAMMAHPWPGNIRELENLIERAVLLAEDPLIGLGAMPGLDGATSAPAEQPSGIEDMGLKDYVRAYTAKLERAGSGGCSTPKAAT